MSTHPVMVNAVHSPSPQRRLPRRRRSRPPWVRRAWYCPSKRPRAECARSPRTGTQVRPAAAPVDKDSVPEWLLPVVRAHAAVAVTHFDSFLPAPPPPADHPRSGLARCRPRRVAGTGRCACVAHTFSANVLTPAARRPAHSVEASRWRLLASLSTRINGWPYLRECLCLALVIDWVTQTNWLAESRGSLVDAHTSTGTRTVRSCRRTTFTEQFSWTLTLHVRASQSTTVVGNQMHTRGARSSLRRVSLQLRKFPLRGRAGEPRAKTALAACHSRGWSAWQGQSRRARPLRSGVNTTATRGAGAACR
jgi:hypothetical protein